MIYCFEYSKRCFNATNTFLKTKLQIGGRIYNEPNSEYHWRDGEYRKNPYIRSKKLRTLRLKFSVMHYLNKNPFPSSGDLRQGSSNNSVTNFVLGFPYIFQRETQPSFEDLLLVVLVSLRHEDMWPDSDQKYPFTISRFQNHLIYKYCSLNPILKRQQK